MNAIIKYWSYNYEVLGGVDGISVNDGFVDGVGGNR